jgi:hypothetical protein
MTRTRTIRSDDEGTEFSFEYWERVKGTPVKRVLIVVADNYEQAVEAAARELHEALPD